MARYAKDPYALVRGLAWFKPFWKHCDHDEFSSFWRVLEECDIKITKEAEMYLEYHIRNVVYPEWEGRNDKEKASEYDQLLECVKRLERQVSFMAVVVIFVIAAASGVAAYAFAVGTVKYVSESAALASAAGLAAGFGTCYGVFVYLAKFVSGRVNNINNHI
jgi:hypothetical protein